MQAAPGWYPDPRGGDGYRYWTGEGWAPDPGPSLPPMPTAAHAPPPAVSSSGWERPDPDVARRAYSAAPYLDQIGNDFGPASAPGQVPPWRRAGTWLALAACLAIGFGAGLVVGGSRDDKRTRATSAAPASSSPAPSPQPDGSPTPSRAAEPRESDQLAPTASPPESEPTDRAAPLLNRLGLRPGDVAPDVRVDLIPGGDLVVGQTTLDLCDATYVSESKRTARRQLVAVNSKDAVVISTEAVLYSTAAATAEAFEELKRNSAICDARTGIDANWPKVEGIERLAYELRSPAGDLTSTIIYLRRDRTLLALYFRHPGVELNAVAGHQTVQGVVGAYSQRLAAMPAAAGTVT